SQGGGWVVPGRGARPGENSGGGVRGRRGPRIAAAGVFRSAPGRRISRGGGGSGRNCETAATRKVVDGGSAPRRRAAPSRLRLPCPGRFLLFRIPPSQFRERMPTQA